MHIAITMIPVNTQVQGLLIAVYVTTTKSNKAVFIAAAIVAFTKYCIRQAALISNDLQYKSPPEAEGCLIVILQPEPMNSS